MIVKNYISVTTCLYDELGVIDGYFHIQPLLLLHCSQKKKYIYIYIYHVTLSHAPQIVPLYVVLAQLSDKTLK